MVILNRKEVKQYQLKTCWSCYYLLLSILHSFTIQEHKGYEIYVHKALNAPVHIHTSRTHSHEREFSEREKKFQSLTKKNLSFSVSVAHRLPFCEGKLVLSSEKNTGLKRKVKKKKLWRYFHKKSEKGILWIKLKTKKIRKNTSLIAFSLKATLWQNNFFF